MKIKNNKKLPKPRSRLIAALHFLPSPKMILISLSLPSHLHCVSVSSILSFNSRRRRHPSSTSKGCLRGLRHGPPRYSLVQAQARGVFHRSANGFLPLKFSQASQRMHRIISLTLAFFRAKIFAGECSLSYGSATA